MPFELIPKALYPLVPQAPGVPPVLRGLARVADTATFGLLGLGGILDSLIGSAYPKWGIFDASSKEIALADSVLSLEYSNSRRISDYPLEQGSFSSFNAVENPFDVRITLTRAGSVSDRANFIDAIERVSKSLDLYSVVTPEKTYKSVSIEGFSFRREAQSGANKIIADIFVREIRQSLTTAFLDTKSPASIDPMSQGQVQGVDDATISLAGVIA